MSGLDNIKRQILEEANHSAKETVMRAKAQAEEIIRAAGEQAQAESEKTMQRARAEAENYADRIASSSEMQRKQAMLQAKQEVIRGVIEKAYVRVLSLDDESYFQMIRRMLEEFVLPQDGMICFSASDLKRLPQGFEREIQMIALAHGGSLEVSAESREIDGGFILDYGGIEENCTIRALFEAKRDELSDQVHRFVFL